MEEWENRRRGIWWWVLESWVVRERACLAREAARNAIVDHKTTFQETNLGTRLIDISHACLGVFIKISYFSTLTNYHEEINGVTNLPLLNFEITGVLISPSPFFNSFSFSFINLFSFSFGVSSHHRESPSNPVWKTCRTFIEKQIKTASHSGRTPMT